MAMTLHECSIRYNSGILYTNSFLPEKTPNGVTVSYTVSPRSRVTLIKIFLQVSTNSNFSDVTLILLDAQSGGSGYVTETISNTQSLSTADLSSFYSNSEKLYVRLAVYETVYGVETGYFTDPIIFEKLDMVRYYTSDMWRGAEMLVYLDDSRGWVPSKLMGQLTKAVNSDGEVLTDVNNNNLYVVKKEGL